MLLLVCHRENGYKVNWKVEDNTIFRLNENLFNKGVSFEQSRRERVKEERWADRPS